ncbi:MAG TPA: hypothetical protein VF129_03420 [Actinomycetota bacterium]
MTLLRRPGGGTPVELPDLEPKTVVEPGPGAEMAIDTAGASG